MRIAFRAILAGFMALNASVLFALDGSKELLCATQSVNECLANQGCQSVTSQSMNIPDFFVVDVANKELRSAKRKTPIERVETLDDKLFLQGADDGVEGVRDGLGWTMVIDQSSGKMSLSGSDDRFAVVVFGACMER
ncbi:hypothetical protein MIB92_04080 [Aestuariirhabdus sp. Z084]|uniref:hypothetical protein n=1 Tax=Aestuariirhabdus haliotis TaxID=2918751 RepID=UPI00201B3E84|nr:hypothetical protein [Aestuariirhabdus haliotis]MCL6414820.1 hypothetical protein [Aestuariirhabdus haliotis]MCL6418752.1 hypothetical protein [Aestuariirhabdus haliotis]